MRVNYLNQFNYLNLKAKILNNLRPGDECCNKNM